MIVISYRRDDSEAVTGRNFDRLTQTFGKEAIFRDIDSIPAGTDFREYIGSVLRQSELLVVIVGPRWLGRTRSNRTRIDDPTDLVRVEVETALETNLPVIPVLIGNARMPDAARLPESLQPFAFRNALKVDPGQDFENHINRLTRAINGILSTKNNLIGDSSSNRSVTSRVHLLTYETIVLLMLLGVTAYVFTRPSQSVLVASDKNSLGAKLPAEANPPVQVNSPAASPPSVTTTPEVDEDISTADAAKRGSEALQRKDFADALKWFRRAANKGDPNSQTQIGLLYEGGLGVEKNPEEAMRWFRLAADQGYAEAEAQIGFLYQNGLGVQSDRKTACSWYQRAADKNYSLAQIHLGYCYAYGLGAPKDITKAVEWFRKAAEQGDTNADVTLGVLYEVGNGVPKDYTAASQLFRKAADKGNASQ
jgi:Sel1 repeat/TIR domain